jgi:hypothetical protein
MKNGMTGNPSPTDTQRAGESRGLDLEAWRRERDARVKRPPLGAVSVDTATLWSGRLARYQARRPQPPAAAPRSRPTRAFALSPTERQRLIQVHPGIPRGRCSTLVDTTPARSEVTRDLFRPR